MGIPCVKKFNYEKRVELFLLKGDKSTLSMLLYRHGIEHAYEEAGRIIFYLFTNEWDSMEQDIAKFSKQYPDAVFCVESEEEYAYSYMHIQNGKVLTINL